MAQQAKEWWAAHPEKKADLAAAAKAWWEAHPEKRRELALVRVERYRRHHPERAAAFDRAMQYPRRCKCGADAYPLFAPLPSNEVIGWRCKTHWPPRDTKKPPPGESR